MAAPVRIPNWVEFFVKIITSDGTEEINTFGMKSSTNITDPAVLAGFVNLFITMTRPQLRALITTLDFIMLWGARTLYPGVANIAVEVNDSANGTYGGNPNAGNTTLAVKRSGYEVGRRYRGRLFVPRFDVGASTGNIAHADIMAKALAYATSTGLILNDSGITLTPVTASRKYEILTPVRYMTVDRFMDSMRTRLTGRGR